MTPSCNLLGNRVVFFACGLAFFLAGSALAQNPTSKPDNDDFVSAQSIIGRVGSVTGVNDHGSRENAETGLFPQTSGKSVWYRWVCPATGRWTFETSGSTFDTFLAVFTANTITDLPTTIVATNDDVWMETLSSSVTFDASSNVEYRIMVDGVGGEFGNIVLNWIPAPANDNFANAQVIIGEEGVLIGSNIGATVENGEPLYDAVLAGASVWYRWTAPRSGLVAVDTAESNFDTLLGIFTGTSIEALTLVGANDNNSPDGTSVVWFMATAGESYSVAVSARLPAGVTDKFRLHWAYVPQDAPPNDNFAQAQILTGSEGQATGLNYNATREPGEPEHAGSNTIGRTLWYSWTPSSNGIVVFDAACSSFNTRIALYTGETVDGLTLVTNNQISGLGPIFVPVTMGTAYHLAVDGFLNTNSFGPWLSTTGRVNLHWMMVLPHPVNDNFSDALPLNGFSGSVWGSNIGASKEINEPLILGNPGGASVWYRWVAPADGRFTFDTSDSGFDTQMAVYTGNAVDQLALIAENDDQQNPLRTSSLSFNATAGAKYFITVDGYAPETNSVKLGRFALNWGLRYQEIAAPQPVPTLAIQPDSSGLAQIISWPLANGDCILQTATNLSPTILWQNVSNITVTADFMIYTNNMSEAQSRFFRLFRP